MPTYTCERCLKEFSQKSHYDKHMKKKRPCQNNKCKIEEIVKKLTLNNNQKEETIIENHANFVSGDTVTNFVSGDTVTNFVSGDTVTTPQSHEISDKTSLYIHDANIVAIQLTEKIDFIYLDPPYDTNRNFTLDSKSTKIGFSDKWGDKEYEKWLFKLVGNLKKVMSNVGTMVIHISSENSFIIEKVLREQFKNIEKIYWKRCHGKNTVKNKFGAVIDILFVAYDNKRIFNRVTVPIEENSVWAFKNKDERGCYSLGTLKHDRTRKGHEYTIAHRGVEYKNEFGWKLSKDVVEQMISEDRIHFVPKSSNMYVKIYKHEHKGKPLSNLWNDIHSITRTKKDPRLYPTQKPQKLLERLIKVFTNENSIILDPVCGSGTTGFVADKMNKKCIMIDVNEEVLPIITKRFNDKIYNI